MANEAEDTQVFGQNTGSGNGAEEFRDLPLEEQIAALRAALEEARREIDQNRDTAQRAQAELVNYRKRTDDERLTLQKYSNSRLIVKLLPVVDELELAINHAESDKETNPWLEGVKLIQRKVASLLESEGVARIEALGAQFDPLEHEALGTEETREYPSGHVMEVVRNGYRLHDRVIQPAQVIVAREAKTENQSNNFAQ